MIIVEKINIKGIPSLHIVDESKAYNQLPFVIFNHGFQSGKENNLHYAYLLAEKGIRVVLPESLYHGERQTNIDMNDLYLHFWEIVIASIEELKDIKDYFVSKELIDEERIGLAGTSMGGIITLGALTKYDWIQTAVSLMGMPNYELYARLQIDEMKKREITIPLSDEELIDLFDKLKKYDLSLQPEKLKNRPLFFWHGKLDHLVPFEFAYQFYETMKNKGSQVEFLTDDKAGHHVSREGLLKTVDWFESHLNYKISSPKQLSEKHIGGNIHG